MERKQSNQDQSSAPPKKQPGEDKSSSFSKQTTLLVFQRSPKNHHRSSKNPSVQSLELPEERPVTWQSPFFHNKSHFFEFEKKTTKLLELWNNTCGALRFHEKKAQAIEINQVPPKKKSMVNNETLINRVFFKKHDQLFPPVPVPVLGASTGHHGGTPLGGPTGRSLGDVEGAG